MSINPEQITAGLEQEMRQRLAMLRDYKAADTRPRKAYLNRADRDEAMILAAIAGAMDDLVAGWEERGKAGAMRRAAKLVRYWSYEALTELMRGVDERSIEAVLRDVGQATISVQR